MAGALDRARESFADKAWGDAFAKLSAADAEAPLQPEDLERLAMAAYLTGRAPDCEAAWSRANHELLDRGDVAGAARCAFWLGFVLTMKGEAVLGGGWFARAQRLVDDGELDCAERGYLLVPLGLGSMTEGDDAGALEALAQAGEIAERFADADLRAFAWCGRGGALVRLGELAEGLSLLDEVLVALTAGEVSSAVSGIVYCAAIETFQEAFDLRRAQEWTAALTQWCEAQPDLVPYRGNCLVHRVEIMCLRGAWPDALDEARRACELLTRPPQPAIGEAFYQRAELHRLRGELAEAEEAYSEANHLGRPP
ncbi:MAG: DNA-binding response regulator, partial [Acidimicrobiales bacterium]